MSVADRYSRPTSICHECGETYDKDDAYPRLCPPCDAERREQTREQSSTLQDLEDQMIEALREQGEVIRVPDLPEASE